MLKKQKIRAVPSREKHGGEQGRPVGHVTVTNENVIIVYYPTSHTQGTNTQNLGKKDDVIKEINWKHASKTWVAGRRSLSFPTNKLKVLLEV